jgi:hypothetical protein
MLHGVCVGVVAIDVVNGKCIATTTRTVDNLTAVFALFFAGHAFLATGTSNSPCQLHRAYSVDMLTDVKLVCTLQPKIEIAAIRACVHGDATARLESICNRMPQSGGQVKQL